MNNIKSSFFILIAALLAACTSCHNPAETAEPEPDPSPITWSECSHNIGDHPCDFTLTDQNGNDWNLYENYGSIIVLDFSTEWCYYCQVAAADAQILQDEYADKEVIYVTILIEDSSGNAATQELVEAWAEHFGITAPVLAGSRDMLDSTTPGEWIVEGWPTFYFIDREMHIHTSMRGYSSTSLMTILDQMLVDELAEEEE